MQQFMGEPHTDLPPPSRSGSGVVGARHPPPRGPHHAAAIADVLSPDRRCPLRPAPDEGEFLEVAAQQQGAEQRLTELGVLRQQTVAAWETVEVGPFLARPRSRPSTASATCRCRGSSRPKARGSTTPETRSFTAGGGAPDADRRRRLRLPARQRTARRPPPIASHIATQCGDDACLGRRRSHLLGAREAIPIHYDTIDNPPIYAQLEDPAGTFLREAAALDVAARIVAPGTLVSPGVAAQQSQ